MAIRYAVANGNWSNPATWDGGTTLPGVGDTVRPNGFTVTIDQNVTVGTLTNDASAPAVAGGGFVLSAGYTVTATITGTTNATLVTFSASGAAIITGTVSGPFSSGAVTAIKNSGNGTLTVNGSCTGDTIRNESTGTVSINGNVSAGTGANSVWNTSSGIVNILGNVTGPSVWSSNRTVNNTGSGTVNITGNVTGGGNSDTPGVRNSGSGSVVIVGTVTGGFDAGVSNVSNGSVSITGDVVANSGSGVGNTGSGTVTIVGNLSVSAGVNPAYSSSAANTVDITGAITAGMSAPGFTSTHASSVNRLSGPFFNHATGTPACNFGGTAKMLLKTSGATSWRFADTSGGTRTLYSADTVGGNPAAGNVRLGTTYGPSSELTGTLAVPPAGSVALGVPVDNTTGTASLSNPAVLQQTTIATLASQTSFTLTAGSPDDDAYNGLTVVVTDSATSTQKCVGTVSDYVGATRTVTLAADPGIFAMAPGDSIAVIAGGGGVDAQGIRDAVGLAAADLDDQLGGIQTAADAAGEAAMDAADLLEADRYIDTAPTPWQLVLVKRGTGALGVGTELLRQDLKTTAGADIAAISTFVGQQVSP